MPFAEHFFSGEFKTPPLSAMSPDEVVAAFADLPGQVHLLAVRDRENIAALNTEQPLAIGSTFKL